MRAVVGNSGALAPETHRHRRRSRAVILAALLLGLAALVYRGVGSFEFVNVDDPDYVTQNRIVRGGLSWGGVQWAFATFHAANWHPLTWISHMADASLFGMNAGAHHLASLWLHAASAALLFLLLRALTGHLWRCAAVAALFAVHPVQAESVAWVAERKTVLAALVGLLAVAAYLRQLARPQRRTFPWVAVLFAVGLLAKPMLIVLPFILLLLDWWPLGRFGRNGIAAGATRSLVVEKTPLFVLALASGVVTIAAQSRIGAIASLRVFPLTERVGNALLSYATYLGDLFLPRGLTAFYPHPSAGLPWAHAVLAALALAVITFLAWRSRRDAPYVAFGWLWYLVTLLPVIGILQVGAQARADRYLYLPLIGMFIAIVWGAADLDRRWPRWRALISLAIAAAMLPLALAAHRQAGYWRNSGTLWEHALAVNPKSERALYQLSQYYKDLGRFHDQAGLLRQLVQVNPQHERALNNLVIARYRLGEKPEALLAEFQALLAINPMNAKALQNYGYLLIETGRHAEAVAALESAIAVDPANCTALNNLGRAHLAAGDKAQAQRFFERAAACDPEQPQYRANRDLAR